MTAPTRARTQLRGSQTPDPSGTASRRARELGTKRRAGLVGGACRVAAQRLNEPRRPAAPAVTVLLQSCPQTSLLQGAELAAGSPSFLPWLQWH